MRASPIRQKRNCALNNLAFVQCTVTVYKANDFSIGYDRTSLCTLNNLAVVQCTVTVYRANSFSIGYDRTSLCVLNQVTMLKAIIVVCILDYMVLLRENVLMWNRRGSPFHSLSPICYSKIALNVLQS